jgi:hypothetical protein
VSCECESSEAQTPGGEPEGLPRRWQWIFPVLILAGMILIGVSVLMLLADSTPAYGSDTCAWVTPLTHW